MRTSTSPDTRVLDQAQLGHLRHWDNLSRQLPNDWSLMLGKGVGQDDFGGYRFQLAYMVYGLALAHRHRLPAAPGLFQPVMQRLIEKLLLPEVWMYWRDVSRGGSVFNAHLTDKLHEEWDPVVRDNIMYSAYVQSCALLHDQLFADDRYAAPESLTFQHWRPRHLISPAHRRPGLSPSRLGRRCTRDRSCRPGKQCALNR